MQTWLVPPASFPPTAAVPRADAMFHQYVARVTHADYTAAQLTEALGLTDFPTNVIKHFALLELDEVIAGGTIDSATMELGDAGDPNGLVTSTNVFTGATLGLYGTAGVQAMTGEFEAAFSPELLLTCGTGNVVAATTGIVYVRIYYTPIRTIS